MDDNTLENLPKLPGFSFRTVSANARFNLPQTFNCPNGYMIPKQITTGIGQTKPISYSVKYLTKYETVPLDPVLIYGRIKPPPAPIFQPKYVLCDKKCLTFKAFCKEFTPEGSLENYMIKHVNIIYFLEDDTITVIEPKIKNSGMAQGKIIRRGKIPKNQCGEYWHWKDLAIGRDYEFYGTVFHTVDCDAFTKEYMTSQGLIMDEPEIPPSDPYLKKKDCVQDKPCPQTSHSKLKNKPQYDRITLNFKALWETDYKRLFNIYFFPSDNTVAVKEIEEKKGDCEFPQLLKRSKLPKIWRSESLFFDDDDDDDDKDPEMYEAKDFLIGEKVNIVGREMLLYDCDRFTRDFYKNELHIIQKDPIEVLTKKETEKQPQCKEIPPHDGFGGLEDSYQNTLSFLPTPPKTDVVKQVLHGNKYLRYEMFMESPQPENHCRKFLLFYSLGDSTCKIFEKRVKNSGVIGGKYLKSTLLPKPDTNPLNPEYYSPVDFYIGAVITVYKQKFKICGADLHVYKYIEANLTKFPQNVIDNMKNYMIEKGYIKSDEQIQKEELEKKELEKRNRLKEDNLDESLKMLNLDIIVTKDRPCQDAIKINETTHNYICE